MSNTISLLYLQGIIWISVVPVISSPVASAPVRVNSLLLQVKPVSVRKNLQTKPGHLSSSTWIDPQRLVLALEGPRRRESMLIVEGSRALLHRIVIYRFPFSPTSIMEELLLISTSLAKATLWGRIRKINRITNLCIFLSRLCSALPRSAYACGDVYPLH
jgi:hypothetical protein